MSRANPRFKRTNAPLPLAGKPVYLITAFGNIDSQTWVMTFGGLASDVGQTANSEVNIANSFATTCANAITGIMAADASLGGIKVTCVSAPARQFGLATNVASNGPGQIAGTHLPSEMAGIVSKLTAVKGQHGRGRNYGPAVPASFVSPAVDPNRLNAAGQTAYAFLASKLQGIIATDGIINIQSAIYTRVPKGLGVTLAAPVISAVMRTLLGTVRRRRVGRGK